MHVSTADRVRLCVYTLSQYTKNNISETRLDVIEIMNIAACSLLLMSCGTLRLLIVQSGCPTQA